jgi:hypothetical protein
MYPMVSNDAHVFLRVMMLVEIANHQIMDGSQA